jgi:streptomycin 3"-adenylyltransferase
MQYGWPDATNDIHAQVDDLLQGMQTILGDALQSVVLHGSLAQGSFNPLRSDIDVLAVCAVPLDEAIRSALNALLLRVSAAPQPIEISICCERDLRNWTHPAPFEFHYGESWRSVIAAGGSCAPGHDPDLAAHMAMARARGIALFGPPAEALLPSVPRAHVLNSILTDVLSDAFGVPGFANSRTPAAVVLNACRTLAYGHTGRLLSKDEGGLWALLEIPWRQSSITARALEKYRSSADEPVYSTDEVRQFTSFMLPALRALRTV